MKKKIAIVVSSPMTVKAFLLDSIRALSDSYDVTVVANFTDPAVLGVLEGTVRLQSIPIERRIAVWRDLWALFRLWRYFTSEGFDAVHSVTPKAGLLAMTAARFSSVGVRIHTFTGQVWATQRGLRRAALKRLDRLLFSFSTRCFVDSVSQREFLLKEHVVTADKSRVLADGSISGVDVEKFAPAPEARRSVRDELGIASQHVVFLFLGRLYPDKGIRDLAAAFSLLASEQDDVVLLAVGPDEAGMRAEMTAAISAAPDRIRFVDYTDRPQDYMNAADVLCLPSYREGFGSVVIEAAAVGVPAIGSDIYGVRDAIVDGQTGLLHEVRNVASLHAHMKTLARDPDLRAAMGQAARERVLRDFPTQRLSRALVDEYRSLLGG